MSRFNPLQCMRDMSRKAETTGQPQFFQASDDQPELQIHSVDGLISYLKDGVHVSSEEIAGEMAMQHSIQILRNTDRVIQAVGVSEGTSNADMPATPHTVYDEHGVEQLRVSGLTKREFAEVHCLAGLLSNGTEEYRAVDDAVLAVSVLMAQWAERDTDA
jgi:hypothetical protein